jgi:hypothetical protein
MNDWICALVCSSGLGGSFPLLTGAACIAPYIVAKPLIIAMTSSFAPVSSTEPASSPRK